jgi:hypothetical protein
VSPYEFSAKELDTQVFALFLAVFNNCSCNCNAPKVVVVSEHWKQLPEFLNRLEGHLESRNVPAAYYPGTKDRWEAFRKAYPSARQLGKGLNTKARQLECPALPWLLAQVHVDLSTEQGRTHAQQEYAFRQEPFAPVLTIAIVKCASEMFIQESTTLCNDYLYGSLSVSLSVPQCQLNDPTVEQCLCDLRYGSIVVNEWTAQTYGILGCTWGAWKGETLDSVESGIGHVHNLWLIPHAQKCVLKLSCVSNVSDVFKYDDPVKGSHTLDCMTNFIVEPGVLTFAKFIAAQVDATKLMIGGAALVVSVAIVAKQLLS